MGTITITIHDVDEAVLDAMRRRAADRGVPLEDEVRRMLTEVYRVDQLVRQRASAARLRERRARGLMPRSDVESVEVIRQMREERTQRILDAAEGHPDLDR